MKKGGTARVVNMGAKKAEAEAVAVNITMYKYELYICLIFIFWQPNVGTNAPLCNQAKKKKKL